MFIKNNPKDDVYRSLIDLSFKICDEFILVVRNDIEKSKNIDNVLERLLPYLKEVKKQFQWPGTMIGGDKPVSVYYYHTDKNAQIVLKEVSNSLHSWVQPELPEDLSFIKNSEPWLINTSHELESYIVTTNKNKRDIK